jgi:hypothetical protein
MNNTLRMLFVGIIFFTLCLFAAEKFFTSDGQMFQVLANLLSGFSGALLMGIKKELGLPDSDTGTLSQTETTTVSKTKEPAA